MGGFVWDLKASQYQHQEQIVLFCGYCVGNGSPFLKLFLIETLKNKTLHLLARKLSADNVHRVRQ